MIFLRDLFVDRDHVVVARTVVEHADHRWIAAGEHAQDAAFGAAVVALTPSSTSTWSPCMAEPMACGVMYMSPLDGTALSGVGDDEAVAIAMHGEASGDQVLMRRRMFRKGVAVAIGFDQLARSSPAPGTVRRAAAARHHATPSRGRAACIPRSDAAGVRCALDGLFSQHEWQCCRATVSTHAISLQSHGSSASICVACPLTETTTEMRPLVKKLGCSGFQGSVSTLHGVSQLCMSFCPNPLYQRLGAAKNFCRAIP